MTAKNEQGEAAWREYRDAIAERRRESGPAPSMPSWADWNAGWDSAMAAKVEPVQIDRAGVRSAIARVLVNASNYPPNIGWRTLGVDMGPLINKSTDAILAALAAQPVTGTAEWEYRCRLSGNPWVEVSEDHRCGGVRQRRRKAGEWEEVN